ncbi:hypothetical protein AB0O76_35870 [Streptomyces sp. NPDC086554]|uniref:hypothetical protein n=1 Tax=Streptomyces sp. NPDC086554 TaxID=3154864 RepID=UPI0034386E15
MNLEELRHANFAALAEAITDWSSVIKNLTEMEKVARIGLKQGANRANWAGVNATVSRDFIAKTAGEFSDAVTQATTIHDILHDTHGELIKYRDELNQAIDRGLKKGISVYGVSGGGFKVFVSVHPEPPESKNAVEPLRDELQRILNQASESDRTAAEVLRAIADQAKYGFSDAKYGDRDSAATAVEDAKKWAKAAKHPEDMSDKELAAFNRDLKKYRNDDLFAERFATDLGGKQTLQFWTDITATHQGNRDDMDQLKELQKNFSTTLATATQSDSLDMQKWERDVVREGNTNFRSNASGAPVGVQGFQVMSSLMRHGNYEKGFLYDYGKDLLERDRSHASGAMGTREIWGDSPNIDLVFGKGNGSDPMNGFMDALSRNPDAAEDVFDKKSDLNHLIESTQNTDRGKHVGHALEAAVTGIPYGDSAPRSPIPHSANQVEIVKNMMHVVADPEHDYDLVKKGIGESFGHVAAAYMPEINRTIAGPGHDQIFPTHSQAPDDLDQTDTTRFLYALGKDDDATAAAVYGRGIYTNSTIEAHIAGLGSYTGEPETAITRVAENAGLIDGILNRSRGDDDIEVGLEGDKQTNDALKRQGEFAKTFVQTGIAVGAVTLEGAGGIAREAAIGAGGAFLAGAAAVGIDRIIDSREIDNEDQIMYQAGKELNVAKEDTSRSVLSATDYSLEEHESHLKKDEVSSLVGTAVSTGWDLSDTRLEDVTARPST